MSKRFMILCLSLLMLLTVAALACGEDQDTTKVRLALDWYPNANHAGLFVAQEKGYFEDEGLEVEMYTPVDPSTVNQTVAAGADDFGINYQPDLLMARAQGVPVVSVAAPCPAPTKLRADSQIIRSDPAQRPCWQEGGLSWHPFERTPPRHHAQSRWGRGRLG